VMLWLSLLSSPVLAMDAHVWVGHTGGVTN
jgi:hypothetical protein